MQLANGDDRETLPPPAPAVVAPRVRIPTSSVPILFEKFIRGLIARRAHGAVLLMAGPGGGKSTALAHLRRALGDEAGRILFLDEPESIERVSAHDQLVIVTHDGDMPGKWLARLLMAGWGEDDWIQYCAARRRDQCANVLARLRADRNREMYKGSPQLWRIVLDRLAADDRLRTAGDALREHLDGIIPPGPVRHVLAKWCARVLLRGAEPARIPDPAPTLSDYAINLLRHRAVRLLIAADYLVGELERGDADAAEYLSHPLPDDLLGEMAALLRDRPASFSRVEQMLAGPRRDIDAGAATLLLRADSDWRPRDGRGLNLVRAQLPRARWAGLNLRRMELAFADLHDADLAGSRLIGARAGGADFRGARLVGTELRWLAARGADFSGADFTTARCVRADFSEARLVGAEFRAAVLRMAIFSHADLSHARLVNCDLRQAALELVNLEESELIGARLERAHLVGVRLSRCASVTGVSFREATLERCDLERLRLPRCDFRDGDLTGSYLTGSFIPQGDFRGARLCDCGLAEIEWEDADLRGADLRGSTFHMGSTRSGLVGSMVPGEGSKTGFYTDDFNDRDFLDPEQFRKANLTGADLRGARIDDVDFYLVDLRGARYDENQREQLIRCGAIVDPPRP